MQNNDNFASKEAEEMTIRTVEKKVKIFHGLPENLEFEVNTFLKRTFEIVEDYNRGSYKNRNKQINSIHTTSHYNPSESIENKTRMTITIFYHEVKEIKE